MAAIAYDNVSFEHLWFCTINTKIQLKPSRLNKLIKFLTFSCGALRNSQNLTLESINKSQVLNT